MKRPDQHYDLVAVIWDDALGMRHGWRDKGDIEDTDASIVMSVGFLIGKTKDHITLAMDADGEGGHNGRSRIPSGMVKETRILRKKNASS